MLALLDEGVVVSTSLNQHRVLRLTPPAILTPADEAEVLRRLDEAARTVAGRLAA